MFKLTCAQFLFKPPSSNYIHFFLVKKINLMSKYKFSKGRWTDFFCFRSYLLVKIKCGPKNLFSVACWLEGIKYMYMYHSSLYVITIFWYSTMCFWLGVFTCVKSMNMHIHLPSFILPLLPYLPFSLNAILKL